MKRTRSSARAKLTRDAEELVHNATGFSSAGSRLEQTYWEARLAASCDRLIASRHETALESALDHLYESDGAAYEVLADEVEARSETLRMEADGKSYDVLLIAVPILAWSRFGIPAGQLTREVRLTVRVQLQAHVLAPEAQLALADVMFSPDQLPRGYPDTLALLRSMSTDAVACQDYHVDAKKLPKTTEFLSDARYILGAVTAPSGAPLFRWQEDGVSRSEVQSRWQAQGTPAIQSVLPGCSVQLLVPDAYFAAGRQSDKEARPFSLQAAVSFLETTLSTPAAGLRTVVAPCYDNVLEEYRIGFAPAATGEVCHGVVWPLLGNEGEHSGLSDEILAALNRLGIADVIMLESRFPREYCEDCGAPLFPNGEGELVHAELPEPLQDAEPARLH